MPAQPSEVPTRALDPQMGTAVFHRTYARTENGVTETWGDVADRVALGNVSMAPQYDGAPLEDLPGLVPRDVEYQQLRRAIRAGWVPMSGRHLQQGDALQRTRPQEVFTNCATGAASFLKFYLMLNGAGVGRDYSDRMMLVDWERMPDFYPVLGTVPADADTRYLTPGALHPDLLKATYTQEYEVWDENGVKGLKTGEYPFMLNTLARKLFPDAPVFVVPDTREGWAEVVERLERWAFTGEMQHKPVFIDFSKVRPEGSPIGGMQNRPASGPVPVMQALQGMKEVRGKGWAPWMQTMVVDHHLASCVQVGGARRAARIATKYWKDPGVLEFIRLKTDHQSGGFAKYWSSNNSVTVDAEFWAEAHVEGTWAHTVFRAIAEESYATGEPGVLNVDRLHGNLDGVEAYADGDFATGGSYQLQEETRTLTKALYRAAMDMPYQFIVNPCGEIALFLLGGYCVIADVAPFHCDTLDEAVEAFKLAARALVRVNRMDSTYKRETARTNRIGVGFTGIHEFAWKFFGLTWAELLDENRAHDFWAFWRRVNREVTADVSAYARSLGMVVPHTIFTVKPSGTISSLFGLTQGAHGPNSREILRWVQFDKLAKMDTILDYEAKGYPVLLDVPGRPTVAIVGFPTRPLVRTLGIPEDRFVTADELPFPMHFEWVRLIERHYLGADHGNQVSYTAYFDRATMTVDDYAETLRTWMPQVRCISVLPNRTAELKVQYGYLPQEPISAEEYETLVAHIAATEEAFNASELECGKGGCPIA